ncbi:MAG: SDR family NAD(P)-dependent oxidoreductase [Aquihabitans sp.]
MPAGTIRSVFVTGASGGIGAAVVHQYRLAGAAVATSDLTGHVDHHFDVTDMGATRAAIAAAEAENGPLDLVVACAGMGVSGLVEELTDEQWRQTVDINLFGTINTIRAGYEVMAPRRAGHLVAVASLAGLVPSPLLAPYGTAKHGVVGFMRALNLEAARIGVGTTVVCPGPVDTPLLDDGPGKVSNGIDVRRFLTDIAGPAIAPADVADAVARAVERDQLLVVPKRAAAIGRMQGLAPGLVAKLSARGMQKELRVRRVPDRV